MQILRASPADGLGDEITAAAGLVELLKQEQTHLVGADIDGLTAVTTEKAKAVARIAELAHRRYQALAAAGFDESEPGMQAWLDADPADAAAAASWNELLALARSAKELNRINGMLIGQHMARNQNALHVLQGNQQGNNFYGPDGHTTAGKSTRSLVVG